MNELLKQAQAQIDKALAGSVIIQNGNSKAHNTTIWRGLEQNTKALSELSNIMGKIGALSEDKAKAEPTPEDKYIIMQGDKYYCHAGGTKCLKTKEEMEHLGLEIIKLSFTQATLLKGSTMFGDLCYGGEMIKLYPEPAKDMGESEVLHVLDGGLLNDGDQVTFLELSGEKTVGVIRSEPFKCDPDALMWFFETETHKNILGPQQPKQGNIWQKVQPSDNTEQLPTCTHRHWEEVFTGTASIVQQCTTCGAEKVG